MRVELLRGSLVLSVLPLECHLHSLTLLVKIDVSNVAPVEGQILLSHRI